MSEDSIASDSISCRTEANAPLLPPRKRLLAGLKHNGWPSPSSSSCAAASVELPQVIEALPHTSVAKRDEFDRVSLDGGDGISVQSLNGAAESVDSDSKSERRYKRQRAASLLTTKKSNKKKKVNSDADGHVQDDSLDDKVSPAVDKGKASDNISLSLEKAKDEADLDAIASKISSVVEEHSIAPGEGQEHVEEEEERVPTANEGASSEHGLNSKPDSICGSVHKEEDEEVTCKEAHKASRHSSVKTKKESRRIPKVDDTQKRRRNPKRQSHSKSKESEQKKQEVKHEKVSHMSPPLADEELARQLHRAMNSSPRIARCLSLKEERPLLSTGRKRFPGS